MKYAVNILPLTLLTALVGCSGGGDESSGTSGAGGAGTTGTPTTTGTTDATTTTTDTTTGTTDGMASTTGSTTGTTGGCMATGNSTVMATGASNYTFSSTLSFPPTAVAPDSDLTFDWSALTKDFLGHDLDVNSEINTVNLMLWALTQEELQTKLNDDTLAMSDLAVIATLYNEDNATDGNLFSFTSVGMPIEPDEILPFMSVENYPPDSYTYTAMAATGDELGAGTRMIQAFTLDSESTNTEVVMTDESTALEYTVDLQSLQSIPVPVGDGAIVLDWDSITTNGLGQEFIKTSITKLAVARYDAAPADLESDFLSLVNFDGSVNADQLWEATVPSGTCLSLADATDATGGAFPGIDADSTWMVALFCGDCQNPAPWFLSFLTPG